MRLFTENYYSRVARQVLRECVSWTAEQVMPLLIAGIGAWLSLQFNLVPLTQEHKLYETAIYTFLLAIPLYVVWQIIRAPYVLDREQRRRIADLEHDRDELKHTLLDRKQVDTDAPRLEGEIASGTGWSPWSLKRGELQETWADFDCHITIRNTGTVPSTVRDFRLPILSTDTVFESLSIDPELAELIRLNGGTLPKDKIAIVQHVSPIVPGGEWRGSVPFKIARSPDQLHGLAIEVVFRDVRGVDQAIPWRFLSDPNHPLTPSLSPRGSAAKAGTS